MVAVRLLVIKIDIRRVSFRVDCEGVKQVGSSSLRIIEVAAFAKSLQERSHVLTFHSWIYMCM